MPTSASRLVATMVIGAGVFGSSFGRVAPASFLSGVSAQAPPQAEPQRPPVFRGGTTFVYLDVYPRQDGQVIEGLVKDDFEVTEDGRPQAVETFQFIKYETALIDEERRDPTSLADSERQAADPRNRVFVAYLDPYSIELDAVDMKSTVMTFLERTISAKDLFGVMTPEMTVRNLTFARRLETLEDNLDDIWRDIQLDGQKKSWPRTPVERQLRDDCLSHQPPGPSGEPRGWGLVLEAHRQDMLMTNLENLMVRLAGLREERKNILFVSQGWLPMTDNGRITELMRSGRGSIPQIGTGPTGRLGIGNQQPYEGDRSVCQQLLGRLAALEFEQRFRDFVTHARRSNVSFYPVDVGGLRMDSGVNGPVATLRTLAENTDGLAIVNTNNVVDAVRKLTNSLAGMYLLGYYSTNPSSDGRYREIKVRVKRPAVEVSARQGYFAPSAAMAAAAARAASAPRSAPTAVDEELTRLARARPDAELFAYAVQVGDRLAVVAELSSRQMESGRWRTGAEVKATVQAAGRTPSVLTAKIDPGARVTTLLVPTTESKGPWKVDVRVSGGGDVLDSSASVSPPAGPLFGEPMLFRANPSPRAPLKAVADFQFRRTERVHVEWRALKALTERQSRLLDSKGQPLAIAIAVTEREDADGRTVLADLTLAPLSEGSYVIELTGSAGPETQRALVAFKVVR